MRTYPIYKGYSDNRVVIGDRIPKCRFSGPLLLLLYWRMISLSALSTTVSVPCPMSNTVLLVIHLRMVYACQPHRALLLILLVIQLHLIITRTFFLLFLQSSVDRMMQRGNASLMVGASSWKDQFIDAFTVQAGKCLLSSSTLDFSSPSLLKTFPILSLSLLFTFFLKVMTKKVKKARKAKKARLKRNCQPVVTTLCTF